MSDKVGVPKDGLVRGLQLLVRMCKDGTMGCVRGLVTGLTNVLAADVEGDEKSPAEIDCGVLEAPMRPNMELAIVLRT